MPNSTVSQVKVGRTVYDICDVTARDATVQNASDISDNSNSISTLGAYKPASDFMKIVSNSKSGTLSGGSGTITVTVTPGTGYTVLGCVGYQWSGTSDVASYGVTTSGNNITFRLRNMISTAARTPTVTAYALCVRNTALLT